MTPYLNLFSQHIRCWQCVHWKPWKNKDIWVIKGNRKEKVGLCEFWTKELKKDINVSASQRCSHGTMTSGSEEIALRNVKEFIKPNE